MVRCFVAIDLDPGLRHSVVEIQKQIGEIGLKLVEPENFHITLKFLGELRESDISRTVEGLRAVKFPVFDLKFMGVGVFPSPNFIRVVWVGTESIELNELAVMVGSKLTDYPDDYKFSAHLTIARAVSRIANLPEKIKPLAGTEIGKQIVKEFRLKKSVLTPNGPKYSDIEIFRLD